MSHVYCPECGYNNPESARFCAKCGAALVVPEEGEQTEAFTPPEADALDTLDDLGLPGGAALVVRSGGGRSGESFALVQSPTSIGRSPECAIFLDDVTVSRKHATFTEDGDHWHLDDQGSLNGTFVNRERVESAVLSDGDELQIGKYRLTFLQR
ncbi:MAG TPA: FHA domain-containing protein [Gaiellaceae bacterium]|nr:FHA domain-containing protein [Gaiellaceae bacterium]